MAVNAKFDVLGSISGLGGISLNETQDDKKSSSEGKPAKDTKKDKNSTPRVPDKTPEEPQKKQAPAKDKKVAQKEPFSVELTAKPKQKALKTRHKNFLMSEKRYTQFKDLARSRGQSENALFNDILTQLFGEE